MSNNELAILLENNRQWARKTTETEPDFFSRLVHQQVPDYLWIGCSDSRVPPNELLGLLPGDLFVHRNVANVVYPADLNCLSVVEYAVDALQVRHIIVCGHYGCGGVRAALDGKPVGLIDNWLTKIKDVYAAHRAAIDSLETPQDRLDCLCELNVVDQVKTLAHTGIVQTAWSRGQELAIHGWIYGIADGLIKDLGVSVYHLAQVAEPYQFKRGTV